MNKKGFTLIELLATISILVLMSVIVGVNLTAILRSTEDQNENFDKEQIEKAACVFADSEINSTNKCKNTTSSCTSITISDLVNSGLLDETYNGKSGIITVTRINGEKKCTFN